MRDPGDSSSRAPGPPATPGSGTADDAILRRVIAGLAEAGCVFPKEEAEELVRAVGFDPSRLEPAVARRRRGEPLPWIVGTARFCGLRVRVNPGVYVPRPHTEALASRAASLLPADGVAVDLCTGSGAVAAVMRAARPNATVLATDLDPVAVACARANGITAFLGDLDGPLPGSLERRVDVMTAVVPYVPTEELALLPRDVTAYEPRGALDGGPGGLAVLKRVARLSVRWLRPGGRLLVELGDGQAGPIARETWLVGLCSSRVHHDPEGNDRAIEAWSGRGTADVTVG